MTQRPPLFLPLVALLFVALAGGCSTASAPFGTPSGGPGAPGFERLLDAVVRIDVREVDFEEGARRMVRGVGSGVIVSAEGLILTNAHVVSTRAEVITVTLANLERVDARLVGWDHWTDLALLQLDMDEVGERGLRFAVAEFGDSNALRQGQEVYAVGTPNGLTRTVTRGIISNPNRYFAATSQIRGYETGYFNTWLQTDAAINPGNSGGPLVTPDGRIIGINTRSYLGANNLSFAVPSGIAREVMQGLARDGRITRSYVGIRLGALRDLEGFFGLDANTGVLVDSVDPGSPAAIAGLLPGDIILSLDGAPVDGRFPEQLPPILKHISDAPVGAAVAMVIKRGEQRFETTVLTEALESRVGEQWAFEAWGMSVQEVSRAIARERRFSDDDGVLVVGLQRAFPADEAGLQAGDRILSVNRERIRTLDDLKRIYAAYEAEPARVLLEVDRFHQASFVVLKPR